MHCDLFVTFNVPCTFRCRCHSRLEEAHLFLFGEYCHANDTSKYSLLALPIILSVCPFYLLCGTRFFVHDTVDSSRGNFEFASVSGNSFCYLVTRRCFCDFSHRVAIVTIIRQAIALCSNHGTNTCLCLLDAEFSAPTSGEHGFTISGSFQWAFCPRKVSGLFCCCCDFESHFLFSPLTISWPQVLFRNRLRRSLFGLWGLIVGF